MEEVTDSGFVGIVNICIGDAEEEEVNDTRTRKVFFSNDLNHSEQLVSGYRLEIRLNIKEE